MYNVLSLTNSGEGHTEFTLGNTDVELVNRFNYSAECWVLDIVGADGVLLIAGLMLVPGVNILKPYPNLVALIGSLVIVEQNQDDYKKPSALGYTVQLLWFPPGEAVVL